MSDLNRPEFVCHMPFNNLELLDTGAIACCGAFFERDFFARHADSGEAAAMWNNDWYQALRASMLDGTYRHCTDRCPEYVKIRNRESTMTRETAGHRIKHCIESGQGTLPMGPRWIALSNDRSCNLCCRSCRADKINDAREVHDRRYDQAVALLEKYGKDLECLAFSSTGEPFFSRYYLRLMREYLCREKLPKANIHIGTNGTLLDEKMWQSMKCKDMVHLICVSIDAATKETYEKVRGPNWDRLMDNLAFIKSLHEAKVVPYFQIRMVVQALNWREMEQFAYLASTFMAHPVYQLVYPWGTLTSADMIYYKDHPDYEEFIAHLRAFDAKYPWVEAYYRQLL